MRTLSQLGSAGYTIGSAQIDGADSLQSRLITALSSLSIRNPRLLDMASDIDLWVLSTPLYRGIPSESSN
jgi:hypothetical protein